MTKSVWGTRALAISAAIAASLTLGACSAQQSVPENSAAAVQEVVAGPVTIADPWIKAVDTETTDASMTGAFGTVTNTGDAEVTIVGASSDIAGMVELHETIVGADGASVMQPIEGGFTIPAGESLELKPGGNHIMFMMLTQSILPGDEVPVTLEFADGSTAEVTFVAKEYTGAQETYAPDGSMGNNPHGGMSHSSPDATETAQ